MADIHPTTAAIIAGLRGIEYVGSSMHLYLASEVQRLVRETELVDAGDIAKAGEDGWDLGYRQDGQRFELTARSREGDEYEMLVTAMIDRRAKGNWVYHWLVQALNPARSFPHELMRNSTASTFQDAINRSLKRIPFP